MLTVNAPRARIPLSVWRWAAAAIVISFSLLMPPQTATMEHGFSSSSYEDTISTGMGMM